MVNAWPVSADLKLNQGFVSLQLKKQVIQIVHLSAETSVQNVQKVLSSIETVFVQLPMPCVGLLKKLQEPALAVIQDT